MEGVKNLDYSAEQPSGIKNPTNKGAKRFHKVKVPKSWRHVLKETFGTGETLLVTAKAVKGKLISPKDERVMPTRGSQRGSYYQS